MKAPLEWARAGLLLLAVLLAGPAEADAQPSEEFGLAMTRLELSLDLDYRDGSLSGWASYEIVNLSGESTSELPFNLGRLMTVQAARGPEGITLDFTQDVAVFVDSPRRQVNHIVVSLSRPLAPDSSVVLRLDYHGYLVGYTETGSLYIQDRVDEDFSILREDAFAWPALGTLSRRINRVAPRPDFRFNARITVPEQFTVASGGRLVEKITDEGRTTFVYESIAPVPFLNLPVAEYALMSRGGIRVYYFPPDSAGALRVLNGAAKGLALLEDWFGPLGVDPDIAVMEIPERWGSQASLTGGIIQTADAFRDASRMLALYHELTHLWNVPDLDQPSARWNEGLATLLAMRMAEELDDREGMEGDVRRTVERIITPSSSSPEIRTVPFVRYGDAGVTDLSYRVGFLMFYALHRALGDEEFDAALRGYYQKNRELGGTFEMLMKHLDARSPIALDGFFHDWVYTTAWYDQLRAGVPAEAIGFD
ncbi:MAG: hypothetical protein P8Y26_01400 [Gemmatimonadales bacterium]